MGDQRRPLQPEELAPAFALPAANLEGMISFDSLRGRPFLIGFYRGLHCPFCRRQVLQLGSVEPPLRAMGVETLAVINTPLDHASAVFPVPADAGHASLRSGLPYTPSLRRAASRVPAGWGQRPARVALSREHGGVRCRANQSNRRAVCADAANGSQRRPQRQGRVQTGRDRQCHLRQPRYSACRTLSGRCGRHGPLGTNRGGGWAEQHLHLSEREADHRRRRQPWTLTSSGHLPPFCCQETASRQMHRNRCLLHICH